MARVKAHQVVFQEDNAGPHIEGTYRQWMEDEFQRRGWRIELQAPEGMCFVITPCCCDTSCIPSVLPFHLLGPYTNVLDLSVFQMMSKRVPDLELDRSTDRENLEDRRRGVGQHLVSHGGP